jgi:hypothetical protein
LSYLSTGTPPSKERDWLPELPCVSSDYQKKVFRSIKYINITNTTLKKIKECETI